jgi:hypothetical protein
MSSVSRWTISESLTCGRDFGPGPARLNNRWVSATAASHRPAKTWQPPGISNTHCGRAAASDSDRLGCFGTFLSKLWPSRDWRRHRHSSLKLIPPRALNIPWSKSLSFQRSRDEAEAFATQFMIHRNRRRGQLCRNGGPAPEGPTSWNLPILTLSSDALARILPR